MCSSDLWALASGEKADAQPLLPQCPQRFPNRFFRVNGMLSEGALAPALSDAAVVAFNDAGSQLMALKPADAAAWGDPKAKPAPLWTAKLDAGQMADAIAIVGDQVWVAGGHGDARSGQRQGGKGWLRSFGLKDGKPGAAQELPAPPTFQGIASADGRLLLALDDGTLRAYGR